MLGLRNIYMEILRTLLVLLTPIMMEKLLQIVTNCRDPVFVSDGTSMEATLHRGDILILSNHESIRLGDIVIFKLKDTSNTIVYHRVIALSKTGNGVRILTKGDNNIHEDRNIYGSGKFWLNEDDILGRVSFMMPHIGRVFLLVNENPFLKGLLVLIVASRLLRIQFRLMYRLLFEALHTI